LEEKKEPPVKENRKIYFGFIGKEAPPELKPPRGYEITLKTFEKTETVYDDIAKEAIKAGSGYLFILDGDLKVTPECLYKLFLTLKNIPFSIVGGYYKSKYEGGSVILDKGVKKEVPLDGKIYEVASIGARCLLLPVDVLKAKSGNWFGVLSKMEHSKFSEYAKEQGYKLIVDSMVQCNWVTP